MVTREEIEFLSWIKCPVFTNLPIYEVTQKYNCYKDSTQSKAGLM